MDHEEKKTIMAGHIIGNKITSENIPTIMASLNVAIFGFIIFLNYNFTIYQKMEIKLD